MSKAFDDAMARAARGLDWSYPCLVWMQDYVTAETSRDPSPEHRSISWDEPTAKRELFRLAQLGNGVSAVERALDGIARAQGWQEADGARQGALMVGIYNDPNGEGYPAIFDGQRGWLVAFRGDATILRVPPDRMWEVVT